MSNMRLARQRAEQYRREHPTSAACCTAQDIIEVPFGNAGGFCEGGCSGAHIEHVLAIGCDRHGQQINLVPPRTVIDRSCPCRCDWSRVRGDARLNPPEPEPEPAVTPPPSASARQEVMDDDYDDYDD